MPMLAAAAPYIAIAAAGVQALGTIAQGNAQRASFDNQAAQLNQQAGQVRATAQREQGNRLRAGAFAMSRAQALTAASGADPESVTAVKNQEDLAGQTEYGALTALFNGEEKATGMEYEAQNDYIKGKNAHDAGVISGISSFAASAGKNLSGPTTADSGSTMVTKYTDPFTSTGGVPPWQYNQPLPWLN